MSWNVMRKLQYVAVQSNAIWRACGNHRPTRVLPGAHGTVPDRLLSTPAYTANSRFRIRAGIWPRIPGPLQASTGAAPFHFHCQNPF